jgi:hypothetical protein
MPSPTPINLFVTCTSTKRFLPTGNVLLREVGGSSMPERFSNWTVRIRQSRSVAQPAVETYSGGHWSVVRSLHGSFQKSQGTAHLWIVSAGYGLISPSDEIIPYGATFTPDQPDTVSPVSDPSPNESSVTWWQLLSKWRPSTLQPGAPRSVAEVVLRDPKATNVLVLPPDYFRALREDLRESISRLGDARNLIILSSDEKSCAELPNNTIKLDARLQVYLGGARSSLGIRTARAILQKLVGHSVNLTSAREVVAELVSCHGVATIYNRKPVTDAQVIEYVLGELSRNRAISYSRALRHFRDAGFACEMKRFRKLYAATREQRTASLIAQNGGGV